MIIDALLRRSEAPSPTDDFWYEDAPYSGAVPPVTPTTAMQATAVMACIRVLAESVAQLPMHVMYDDGVRRTRAINDPAYSLLYAQPNERQTSFEFREMQQGHLARGGNAYTLKKGGSTGRLEQLIPLDPTRMTVMRLDESPLSTTGMPRLGYLYRDLNNKQYKLVQDEVIHQRFMTLDGMVGISPIAYCRKAIELSLQSEEHGVRWWRNAAKPGGVIQFPEGVWLEDENAQKRLKKSWQEAHSGKDLYTVALLEGGAKWQALGLSNEDSQWLDSRRFQLNEVCRIFRVPPHMVASAIEHGMTYANVEHSDLSFLKYTLLPWLVRWEQRLKLDVLTDPNTYIKFGVEGLLRADTKTRAEFYKTMWGIGAYSANDVLELEDRNPVDGGDVRYIPTSVMPLGSTAAPPVGANQASARVMQAWAHDIAHRIASAEAREMERRSEDVGQWANEYWTGKHRDYVHRCMSSVLDTLPYGADVDSVADAVCHDAMSAVQQRQGGRHSAGEWFGLRIRAITARLLKELNNEWSSVRGNGQG